LGNWKLGYDHLLVFDIGVIYKCTSGYGSLNYPKILYKNGLCYIRYIHTKGDEMLGYKY